MKVLTRSLVESPAIPSGICGNERTQRQGEPPPVRTPFCSSERNHYLQVGDGRFGSFHLDDALGGQVLLPGKDAQCVRGSCVCCGVKARNAAGFLLVLNVL